MSEVQEFRLELKQQPPVLYGGQLLEGNLIIKVTEPIQIQAISLQFQGIAQTSFEIYRHVNRRRRRVRFSAMEQHFNSTATLFGSLGKKEKLEYPAGERTYPFQFTIPALCPSSFEGPFGHVRYTVSAKLSGPWKTDINNLLVFTVLRHYDLNYLPQLRAPISGEVSGDVGGIIHSKGKIITYLHVNKQGFVPGEDIVVWARIKNESKYELQWSRVFVQQDTLFKGLPEGMFFISPEPMEKDNSFVILDRRKGPIAPGETFIWEYERLRIPPCVASHLPGCEIINIHYRIQFSVHNPHGTDVGQTASITIGTVPLYEAPPAQATAPAPQAQASAPLAPEQPSYGGAPPSYEQCVGGKVNINTAEADSPHENMGDTQFAPIYPTYNFSQQ